MKRNFCEYYKGYYITIYVPDTEARGGCYNFSLKDYKKYKMFIMRTLTIELLIFKV